MAKQNDKEEPKNVVVNQFGDEIEKESIVWENVNGQLMFDSAGNPMDASRKERFYGEAAGQEEVRQIFFTSDIEEASHDDSIRQVAEATRDTMNNSYDPQTVSYGYQISRPGVKIDPTEVGADLPEIFDSQISAKITMFKNGIKGSEPEVDPAELGEEFDRQFRKTRDLSLELSEEHEQENGLKR